MTEVARSSMTSRGHSMPFERSERDSRITNPEGARPPDPSPVCPLCNQSVVEGAVVVYLHGNVMHAKCWQHRIHGRADLKPSAPATTRSFLSARAPTSTVKPARARWTGLDSGAQFSARKSTELPRNLDGGG